MRYLETLNPYVTTLLATLFTWGLTAAGASIVFFFRELRKGVMNLMLGAGAGIMFAACFWSLLAPAIRQCEAAGGVPWLAPAAGMALGAGFIVFFDRLLCKFEPENHAQEYSRQKRSILLVSAITLHNIPEGMVIGVAFASAAASGDKSAFWGAAVLAVGIGLQNFPEGAAVSLPLRRDGMSRGKSFFYGQISGFVEPIFALLGALAASVMSGLVPALMAFSAGAMTAVVVGELVPESVQCDKTLTIIGFVAGFILMMVLDVALG